MEDKMDNLKERLQKAAHLVSEADGTLDEGSGASKFDEHDARSMVERAFLKAEGISMREYQGPQGLGQTPQATKARIVVTRALKGYLDAIRSGR
jgi:hypothetical protein